MSKILVLTEDIPVKTYQKLRIEFGLSPKSDEAAKNGNASYLYKKFGFKNKLPESKGMYLVVK
jgi:hypothetical protein